LVDSFDMLCFVITDGTENIVEVANDWSPGREEEGRGGKRRRRQY